MPIGGYTGIGLSKELKEYAKFYELTRIFVHKPEGTTSVFYMPIDPTTNTIPPSPLESYPKRKITTNTDTVLIIYSKNLHYYYNAMKARGTPILPILFVNYGIVIGYEYYGDKMPPERDPQEQVDDWKSGYMYARVKLPNATWTETKLQQLERELGIKIPRGWYWVKYHARLIELPEDIIRMEEGVLKFDYARPKIADLPAIGKLFDYLAKRKLPKAVEDIKKILSLLGFAIDPTPYEYEGKTYMGIKVFVSKDENSYSVIVPIKRATSAQSVGVALAIALVAIAVAFTVTGYLWYRVAIVDAKLRQERQEQVNSVLNNLDSKDTADFIEYLKQEGFTEEQIVEILKARYGAYQAFLNQDPSGSSLLGGYEKYIKYGLLAIGALFGGILLLNLLQYIPKPRR